MSGDHQTYDELAVGWAMKALEPEDETAFAQHLESCDRCAGTVAETTVVMASLACDLPAAEPSADLRDRLRAAVATTEQLPSGPPAEAARAPATGFPDYDDTRLPVPRPPVSPWRRAVPAALAVAALAVIAALGIWNIVLSESRDELQATSDEQAQIMDSLLAPGHATIAPVANRDGRTVATVVARDGRLQVVTTGLTVNDARDSAYVVWGMGAETPIALGTFDVVRSQVDLRTVGSSRTGLDEFSAYAISLEAGRQPPSVPTDVVAQGEVSS